MDLESIKRLNIPSNDNSVLYLWATAPKLLEAIEVISAWGFTYKTHCVWDKEVMGMGYWWRSQHELLIVAVKGKMSPPSKEFRERSIYKEKRTKHSKKPIYFRDFISSAFPNHTKLELFARENYPGWDSFGNEIQNSINITIKEDLFT